MTHVQNYNFTIYNPILHCITLLENLKKPLELLKYIFAWYYNISKYLLEHRIFQRKAVNKNEALISFPVQFYTLWFLK